MVFILKPMAKYVQVHLLCWIAKNNSMLHKASCYTFVSKRLEIIKMIAGVTQKA